MLSIKDFIPVNKQIEIWKTLDEDRQYTSEEITKQSFLSLREIITLDDLSIVCLQILKHIQDIDIINKFVRATKLLALLQYIFELKCKKINYDDELHRIATLYNFDKRLTLDILYRKPFEELYVIFRSIDSFHISSVIMYFKINWFNNREYSIRTNDVIDYYGIHYDSALVKARQAKYKLNSLHHKIHNKSLFCVFRKNKEKDYSVDELNYKKIINMYTHRSDILNEVIQYLESQSGKYLTDENILEIENILRDL